MKRNNLILGFVICALFLVGIGFALTSGTLTATGNATAKINQDDFVVVFESSVDASYYLNENKTVATFNVQKPINSNSPTATVHLSVINQSDELSGTLSAPTVEWENKDYFTVVAEWEDGNNIAAGDSKALVITITLITTPADEVSTGVITVTFDATAVPLK